MCATLTERSLRAANSSCNKLNLVSAVNKKNFIFGLFLSF